jgi:iron complex transport system ATP-binding protein
MKPTLLSTHQLAIGYPQRTIARDISFNVNCGEVIAVLGPNGCGKTTLFRTLLGLSPAISGEVQLNGKSIQHMRANAIARSIAYVPQINGSAFDFSVIDIVEMARVTHIAWHAKPSKYDHACAIDALDIVGMADFRERRFAELSGGERQLVMIARSLASQANIILMDEPTASLDFGNQLRVHDTINTLKTKNVSILFTTHHPNEALLCATRTIAIDRHGVVHEGETSVLLTPDFVAQLYGVSVANLARVNASIASIKK